MAVDLKRNSHEKEGSLLGSAPDEEKEDYFYGLQFSLEGPELQKVPITTEMVGKDIQMEVTARVVGFTDEEKGKSARLEIRAIGMKPEPSSDREAVLYDN